jgi:hypothetical protein
VENSLLLFPEKEAKSVVLLRRRLTAVSWFDPSLGEADPGGLGACPQKFHQIRSVSIDLVHNLLIEVVLNKKNNKKSVTRLLIDHASQSLPFWYFSGK